MGFHRHAVSSKQPEQCNREPGLPSALRIACSHILTMDTDGSLLCFCYVLHETLAALVCHSPPDLVNAFLFQAQLIPTREVMQLFSIGTAKLNQEPVLSASGNSGACFRTLDTYEDPIIL